MQELGNFIEKYDLDGAAFSDQRSFLHPVFSGDLQGRLQLGVPRISQPSSRCLHASAPAELEPEICVA